MPNPYKKREYISSRSSYAASQDQKREAKRAKRRQAVAKEMPGGRATQRALSRFFEPGNRKWARKHRADPPTNPYRKPKTGSN